ncbi:hypothetical protein ACIRS3_13035, partial [Streptomyces virginiae]
PDKPVRTRAPLGVPLTELPPTATPSGPAPAAATAPAMPTVQRQTEPAPSGPAPEAPGRRMRSRAPLGAPLSELPPTATPSKPAAGPAATPALPTVQRQAEPAAGGPAPAGPRVRSGLGAPLPSMPASAAVPASGASSGARGHASLLGAGPSATQPRTGGPAGARPPVQRSTATPRPSGPVPLVAARAVGGTQPAPDATAPRALQLLAARPLSLGTLDVAGMGAAPAAAPGPRPAGRPVVPARWSAPSTTAPQQTQQTQQTQQVQRAADARRAPAAVSPRPARPVRPAPAASAARATAAPLPVTGPYTPPLVVQPAPAAAGAGTVPVVRPRAAGPAAGPGPAVPAPPPSGPPPSGPPPPVQRDTGRVGRTGPGTAAPAAAARRPEDARDNTPHGGGDLDLDDLARRLLDPVARLLRTELRRGRERAGRPFDGRR